ncbi:hypothetical protein D3C76_1816090 [compost metagenome]
MRRFGLLQRRTVKQLGRLADQPLLCCVILLNYNAAGLVAFKNAIVPQGIQQPFPAVAVMEQGGIEPAAVQIDRL